jgi:hypothetical protein
MSLPTPPDTRTPLAAAQVWQLQVLGGLQAQHGNVVLSHFGSRSVAALAQATGTPTQVPAA